MPRIHTDQGDVELTCQEHALYELLADEPRRVHSREELCAALGLTAQQLDSLVVRLRQQIYRVTQERWVLNVWSVGYRLQDDPES